MKYKRKNINHLFLLGCLTLLILGLLPVGKGMATTANDETSTEIPASLQLGRTTASVNVREGAGEGLYEQVVVDGERLVIAQGTEVIITEQEVYQKNGKVWYHVIFYRNGTELSGWVTSSYVDIVGTVTPTPTPSPVVTPSPTPTVTPIPTPSPTPTEVPVTVTPMPTIDSNSPDFRFVWGTVAALAIIIVIAVVIIFFKNKSAYSGSRGNEMSQKMKKLKNINLSGGKEEEEAGTQITQKKRPEIRIVNPEDEEDDYDPSLFEEEFEEEAPNGEGIKETATKESDEKKALRAEINRLKQHDIVIHKYFGKGEVYDNSDVKLLEVRFGTDVRFLNKESLVSKRLLKLYEEDKRGPRKRL